MLVIPTRRDDSIGVLGGYALRPKHDACHQVWCSQKWHIMAEQETWFSWLPVVSCCSSLLLGTFLRTGHKTHSF